MAKSKVIFKDLKEAVIALNKTGVLDKNIKVIQKADALVAAFIIAIDGLSKKAAKGLPKKIRTFYNNLPGELFDTEDDDVDDDDVDDDDVEDDDVDDDDVDDDDDDDDDVEDDDVEDDDVEDDDVDDVDDDDDDDDDDDEPVKEKKKKKTTKKKKVSAKTKKTKKEKVTPKSIFGHRLGTMAGTIDELLARKGGIKEKDAIKKIMKTHNRDKKKATNAWDLHRNHLEKIKGIEIKHNKKKDTYSAKA